MKQFQLQVAQVHRKSGDLEAADRHLEAAMYSLEQLRDNPSYSSYSASASADSNGTAAALQDLLKDLQASLGQVCVEKKEYSRAQELYLMAFSSEVQTGPSLLGDLPSLVKQDSKTEKKEKHKIRIESRSVVDCPEDMRCAIDGKVMVNPVQSPYGHFFEKKTLEKWFANCGSVCPITQKSLRLDECQSDPDMKKRCRYGFGPGQGEVDGSANARAIPVVLGCFFLRAVQSGLRVDEEVRTWKNLLGNAGQTPSSKFLALEKHETWATLMACSECLWGDQAGAGQLLASRSSRGGRAAAAGANRKWTWTSSLEGKQAF
eukprot:Skav233434  [mRNA]  locus=scaffold1486:205334:218822:+ [translate_table: standard]